MLQKSSSVVLTVPFFLGSVKRGGLCSACGIWRELAPSMSQLHWGIIIPVISGDLTGGWYADVVSRGRLGKVRAAGERKREGVKTLLRNR